MRLNYAETRMQHWNPGAEMPLILPVHMLCNTSDDDLARNIKINSAVKGREWIKTIPAHDGVAVLCGSGPSLTDSLLAIRLHRQLGHKIFAMNGAAKYLSERRLTPDYQVIVDPQEETKQVIGPANEHLFASQCNPALFEAMPTAKLWHLASEGIDDHLPDGDYDLTLIGGSSSVGNCATCLAYTMGYRNLQIYGYDSSHRAGKGHAFYQKMNEGDPCCEVEFGGVTYTASLTMKSQAERFMETSRELKLLGVKIEVHGDGLLPAMFRVPYEPMDEKTKYRKMWEQDSYRLNSPGLACVPLFMELVKPEGIVIDFGCGPGTASLEISKTNPVILLDIADNCRNEEAKHLPFIECDFRVPIPVGHAKYGFCCDVMEHIPSDEVHLVINNIMAVADTVFFQICILPDAHGELIGEYLHLTVRPAAWWNKKFKELGYSVRWEEATHNTALFVIDKAKEN